MDYNHRVAFGRATLATHVVGSGSPVIFLHSNVCDSRMWSAQLAAVNNQEQMTW